MRVGCCAFKETIAPPSCLGCHVCRGVLEEAVAPASARGSCTWIVHCCKERTSRIVGGHDYCILALLCAELFLSWASMVVVLMSVRIQQTVDSPGVRAELLLWKNQKGRISRIRTVENPYNRTILNPNSSEKHFRIRFWLSSKWDVSLEIDQKATWKVQSQTIAEKHICVDSKLYRDSGIPPPKDQSFDSN